MGYSRTDQEPLEGWISRDLSLSTFLTVQVQTLECCFICSKHIISLAISVVCPCVCPSHLWNGHVPAMVGACLAREAKGRKILPLLGSSDTCWLPPSLLPWASTFYIWSHLTPPPPPSPHLPSSAAGARGGGDGERKDRGRSKGRWQVKETGRCLESYITVSLFGHLPNLFCSNFTCNTFQWEKNTKIV